MSTVQWNPGVNGSAHETSQAAPPRRRDPLHRVREVREQQGISLRTAARRMEVDLAEAASQERETTDLRLSHIYQWQQVLGVPLEALLVEQHDGLSAPVLKRARMVRLMKTAAAILDKSEEDGVRRLATMLTEQLVEMMPELENVSPWHAVGQRRSLDEMGRAAERSLPEDWFQRPRVR